MTAAEYARNLEEKLVGEFKEKFEKKLGYYPIVITKRQIEDKNILPCIGLKELSDVFTPYLPIKFSHKKVLKLESKHRDRSIVDLRNIFCFLAKSMGYTLTNIGAYLNRDHTTIIHCINNFKALVEVDSAFKEKYNIILHNIKENYNGTPALDNVVEAQYQS
jgi:hypothetical protein